ncbi:13573_t:CDS:2 [Acaulospora morrowiae]|uniref:13573_t:CDS:1 n=1 Tax=Acaulospora morrowiae TaxID=94023 RepID=A0A9N9HSL7_9GLOM|nr:13573_t:CDS:2 [Acaulospora morrowiae]
MSFYPGDEEPRDRPYEDPAVIEQQRIAEKLGPCPKGGLHELRSYYTSGTLFWAFVLGLPRFCGYSKKKTVCKKCNATFKGFYFPEAGSMD